MQIQASEVSQAHSFLAGLGEQLTRRDRPRRALVTGVTGAVAFLAAAGALAALAPWDRPLRGSDVALVLLAWVVVERVRFPVGDGWTYPTMLVSVPALFILPTPVVPLLAAVAVSLRSVSEMVAGRVSATTIPAGVGDAWFSFGPALVIVVSGAQQFAWSHWPVYALALLVQMGSDVIANRSWLGIGERVNPRVQLPRLGSIYFMDATLAPLGLLIASAAVHQSALLLFSLSPVAMLVAFGHERRHRLEQTMALSTAYRGTALLLGDVVEADDNYTGAHSRDVVNLAIRVADGMGLNGQQRRNVELAALLHDVGKLRVPKEIINKPGALEAHEWQILRLHTIYGETMLEQIGGSLSSVGRFVRWSHERYDGLGYPDGLSGEEIPIESRIVSVCDAFSAMTTDRAYRRAIPPGAAVQELRSCAGSQFDRNVVTQLARIVESRPGAGRPTLELLASRVGREVER